MALVQRLNAGTLTWRGPALMLFARSACAVGAQALSASIFLLKSSPTSWLDAAPWLPAYGILIDAGRLTLLWWLTRREGIGLFDLIGFERVRLFGDVLLDLALIPVGLACRASRWSAAAQLLPSHWFMAFRMLSPIPFSVFQTLLYLRLRRLIPFVVAHALMDGASVVIGVLLPLLRA